MFAVCCYASVFASHAAPWYDPARTEFSFQMRNLVRTYVASQKAIPSRLGWHLPNCDADAFDLFTKCLNFDPHARIKGAKALSHPFLAAQVTADDMVPR
jgi:hypothetical protein